MIYNPETDKYEPISWEDAFALVGDTLRALESPHQASFYTSGRLSNEATFLYQLWVREFGTNNLPDCSNMCHEASGRALTAAIGTGKGTVDLDDWEQADAIWLMGDNAASNAPRMLTWLAEADRRGAQLVHINPLIEAASRRTIVPHEFVDMATFHTTETGTMNVQVRIGGDMALLRGVAKAVLEAAEKDPTVLDREFIEYHTHGFDEYRALVVVHAVVRHRRRLRHCRGRHPQARRTRTSRRSASSSPGASASRSTSTASTRCARSSTCCSCAATSAARERDRARSAGTATCRATAPAASTTVPTRRFSTASPRSAGSTRRASTAWAPSRRSRRCTAAT